MRPECRVRGNKAPNKHFRPECQPGRCGLRCTLSLWRAKKEDRKGIRKGKGFRDECLLKSLSSGSLICVAMREVVSRGVALDFGVFMEVEDKQNPKTGDTWAVV